MLLGFKTKMPNGKPSDFVRKIRAGEKIHTMRANYRWSTGTAIHMATGIRTKHYQQFNADRPDLQICKGTQTFWLRTSGEAPYEELHLEILFERAKVYSTPTTWEFRPGVFGFWESQINSPAFPNAAPNKDLQELATQIARNDGFDSIQALFDWFRPDVLAAPGQPWERRIGGQIIHWTDFRY